MTIGENIRNLMILNKWKAKELAEAIDISESYFSKILNDKIKNPDPEIYHKLAEKLNCTVEDIITVDEEKIYLTEPEILDHMPEDLKEFILSRDNEPYIRVGKIIKQLSDDGKKDISNNDLNFIITGMLKMHQSRTD